MFRLIMHSRRNDSGAAAVEFALVALLLVTILLGIIQFGYIFYQWVEITSAAREGARWAALRHDGGSVTTPDTTRYKVRAAAPGMSPPLTDAQITINPEDPDDADVGNPVTVTVTHDVPLFAPMMQAVFGTSAGSITLSSTATMRVE